MVQAVALLLLRLLFPPPGLRPDIEEKIRRLITREDR